MKERITITLDTELLNELDKRIDGRARKNRSQEIEEILEQALGQNIPSSAVLLAGGLGTRLRPLTLNTPKALVDVHGKTITEHIFDLLKKYRIRNVYMSIGYLKGKIRDHFGDGSGFGLSIEYIEENEPLGTAGCLRMLKGKVSSSFIVSNGDELKKINIARMFRLHKRKNALVTIALTTVQDPSQYGVARLEGSRIIEFVEKPKAEDAPSNLINAGFYILEPEVIDMVGPGKVMFEKDIFPKLAAQGKVRGFPFAGQWFDTGNMDRLKNARDKWKDIQPYERFDEEV